MMNVFTTVIERTLLQHKNPLSEASKSLQNEEAFYHFHLE